MKLMLLIIPTIQKTVRTDRDRVAEKRITPGAERIGDEVDREAEGDANEREPELAERAASGPAGRAGRRSRPKRGRERAAQEQADELGRVEPERDRDVQLGRVDEQEHARHEQERGRDGDAAAARDRDQVHPACVGPVDDLVAPTRSRRTSGVRTRDRIAAADQRRAGTDDDVAGGADERHRVWGPDGRAAAPGSDHSAGRPGTGKRPTIVGTSCGQLGLGGRVVALRDRVDDEPADLAHLVRPEPARRRGRRPDPDPGRRVRRLRVERDLRSC